MNPSGALAPLNPRTVLARCIAEIKALFQMWHDARQIIRPSVDALRKYCARQIHRPKLGRSTILRALAALYGSFVQRERRYRRSSLYLVMEPAQMSFSFTFETAVETAVVTPVEKPCSRSFTLISSRERTHQTEPKREERREMAPQSDFQEYFGIFVAAGKPLNEVDMRRAAMQWVSMTEEDRRGALLDARRTCVLASSAHFVPFPINHLLARGWTRVALVRTLPTLRPADIKAGERDIEAKRLLSERLRKQA